MTVTMTAMTTVMTVNSQVLRFALDFMPASLLSREFDAGGSSWIRSVLNDLVLAHQTANEAGASIPTGAVALDLLERVRSDWPEFPTQQARYLHSDGTTALVELGIEVDAT